MIYLYFSFTPPELSFALSILFVLMSSLSLAKEKMERSTCLVSSLVYDVFGILDS